jgi:predicted GTPase
MGYGDEQVRDLEATIRKVPCDVVIIGTPIDFRRVVKLDKESVRVTYELEEIGRPKLEDVLGPFAQKVR